MAQCEAHCSYKRFVIKKVGPLGGIRVFKKALFLQKNNNT